MKGVDFDKAKESLPTYCLGLMQNVSPEDQQTLKEAIPALDNPVSPPSKVAPGRDRADERGWRRGAHDGCELARMRFALRERLQRPNDGPVSGHVKLKPAAPC
jgi:hypothetical protein